MLIPRFTVPLCTLAAMVVGTGVVSGQNYPNKPIRFVTGEVGGSTDPLIRLIAPEISGSLGRQLIVENRAGAIIPGEIVSRALPDGYTLLISGSHLWITPLLQKTPYDPVKDFLPITLLSKQPSVLVVHPSSPVMSVKELIAYAKAKPGELNYASGPTGVVNHLAAELFKAMAGVNIVRISYKGGGPAMNSLIGGEVQLMFATAVAGMLHVKSGRLRALAVTSAKPSVLVPGLPTVAASGLPSYEAESAHGIFAPAGTPSTIVSRLNQEIVRAVNKAELKEKFLLFGVEPVGTSPEELAAAMKSETTKIGRLIKDAGIRAD